MGLIEEPDDLDISSDSERLLVHSLFRFPAKFHPPVAQALIRNFSEPGDLVLDPFCGSGTLLAEAARMRRRSIGTDVDPVAVSVSSAKTGLLVESELLEAASSLLAALDEIAPPQEIYESRKFEDISQESLKENLDRESLWVPDIPNLDHWFRRYVTLDLARIYRCVIDLQCSSAIKSYLLVVFASVIRNASNADPVPVSGLEVTAHMKRLDAAGRVVNPYFLFRKAMGKAVAASKEYGEQVSPYFEPRIWEADATSLDLDSEMCDLVITSPPYHNAVDYYRRHQLEMFWLRHTRSQKERLDLLPKYIGRHRIPRKTPILATDEKLPALAAHWESEMAQASIQRAVDFRHYALSMRNVFRRLSQAVKIGGKVVLVVGRSSWNGDRIPTDDLFVELASENFSSVRLMSYPVKNRYMSYARRNSASIDREYVLVLQRKI
ncbi:DNA methyltransferase [Frankia sp. EAN1pec]|uniref:DNA methyltransferase n=1 Tax=Parafrankia sp. (strain EAN1pec) TaxID=298653 RepID=UPI0018DDB5D1